jgi:hypothetical protein
MVECCSVVDGFVFVISLELVFDLLVLFPKAEESGQIEMLHFDSESDESEAVDLNLLVGR